jgi:Fic family protein
MNSFDLTSPRPYEASHPWICFKANMREATPGLWIMLGECHSKCEHLAGVPLDPQIGKELHAVYLAKGIAATTAIEGNTLTEEQVRERIEGGGRELGPSQQYLGREIDNILAACNSVLEGIMGGAPLELAPSRIKELNRLVLDGLAVDERGARPGEVRRYSVGVGRYRGAPWEDCEYLLERLCDWLNGPEFSAPAGMEILYAILKAVLAHLYIAWIHPFGDGNGRTARLVEVQILLASGVPSPAAQLLSNHYNKTRTQYYRHLDLARGDVRRFIEYAIEGFRDGLRGQIESVRQHQWHVSWINHVHRAFDNLKGSNNIRRKHLTLDLSEALEPVPYSKLIELSPRVAVAYKDLAPRTLSRDIEELERLELVVVEGKWVRAKKERVLAFLPVRARR